MSTQLAGTSRLGHQLRRSTILQLFNNCLVRWSVCRVIPNMVTPASVIYTAPTILSTYLDKNFVIPAQSIEQDDRDLLVENVVFNK